MLQFGRHAFPEKGWFVDVQLRETIQVLKCPRFGHLDHGPPDFDSLHSTAKKITAPIALTTEYPALDRGLFGSHCRCLSIIGAQALILIQSIPALDQLNQFPRKPGCRRPVDHVVV